MAQLNKIDHQIKQLTEQLEKARKHPCASDNSNGVPSLAQRRGTARADSGPRLGAIAAQPASETDVRPTAQEIVATKLANFGRKRRAVAQAMARQRKVQVPDEV